jgi:hypothetical protein
MDKVPVAWRRATLMILGPLILFAVWYLVYATGAVTAKLLPSPIRTFQSIWENTSSGGLGPDLLGTVTRTLRAFLIAALANILDRWKTVYGLTDSRLIIAVGRGGSRGSTRSYGAQDIEPLTWTGGKDWGSVFFGEAWGEGGRRHEAALYGITDPAKVIDLITETLLKKNL